MRKVLISLVVVLFVFAATNVEAQIRVGAKGGLNVAKAVADGPDSDSKLGIHLGAAGEYEIIESFSAQSGLVISTKGGNYDNDVKVNLTYLEIPLHGIYKYDLGDFIIYGKGGFDIGVGLAGKVKFDGGSESIEWGSSDTDNLKRLELAFFLGAGVELMENLQVGLGYHWGLNDLSPSGDGDAHNRVFEISATYFFTEL